MEKAQFQSQGKTTFQFLTGFLNHVNKKLFSPSLF